MNEEIKEIFRRMNDLIDHRFDKEYHTECDLFKDIQDLLDYITNLQQENERLKANYKNDKSHQINYNYFKTLYSKADKDVVIDDLVYKCEDLDNLRQNYGKQNIELSDYKSRCKKTIEYINFVINHYKEQLETPIEDTYFDSDVNRKGYILSIIAYLQTILDTLIGSDENE